MGLRIFDLIGTAPDAAEESALADFLRVESPHFSRLEARNEPGFAVAVEPNIDFPYPDLGFVSESLRIELSHALTASQELPGSLLPLWDLCNTSISAYPSGQCAATREALDAYWERTRGIYGDLEHQKPS